MGIINAWRELFRATPENTTAAKPLRRRAYAGAESSRLTMSWLAPGSSADVEISGSIQKLRDRSRQLLRDNVYARQAQRTIANNVIGQGVRFQAQVKNARGGKLNQKLNDQIEKAFREWSRFDSCSANGRDSFAAIQTLIIKSIFESGEVFVRLIRKPFGRSSIPLALELIESDQLDSDYAGATLSKKHSWRLGIERDEFQRATRYAFLTQHPGDSPFPTAQGERAHLLIDASECLHLFIGDRPGQTRGAPWLASAMKDLHHLAGFQEAQVVRARAASSLMAFVQSDAGELDTGEVMDDERVTDWKPASFHYLAPGETVSVPDLDAPNGEFEPFMRAMLRSLASGAGCSYESVSRDFSQSNYSSSRLSLIQDRDHYRQLQAYLEHRFFQPLFDAWLDLAVLSGNLKLPAYETEAERYRRVRWVFRGWAWVDPQKEVNSAIAAVKAGFKTQSQVISELGNGDIEELLAARRNEIDMAEQLQLSFETTIEATPENASNLAEEI